MDASLGHPDAGAVPAGERARRFFQQLGDYVEAAFRRTGYDEAAFPELAAAALAALPPSAHVDPLDTLEWVLSAPLPRQASLDDPFGQPAVQVYTTQRWYIEVLHWLDGTTAIHQHSFNGAFHVLGGSSIHGSYRFDEERRYGARLRLGQVRREHIELLGRGDTRPIHAGPALIHSLFHLDRPSVTVVVRTAHVADAGPQLSYLPPRLGYDPFFRTEALARQLQTCGTLARLGHPRLDELLGRLYRESDPLSFVRLVLATAGHLDSDERLAAALAAARAVHGELCDALLQVAHEQRRQDRLVALRHRLRHAEGRFLLALLLYFDSGGPILDFVRRRWPERDAEATVVGWLNEAADLPDPARPRRRLFDFELRGAGGTAARAMLGGRSLDQVVERLRQELDPAEVERQRPDLATLQAALRDSVFGPLFRR